MSAKRPLPRRQGGFTSVELTMALTLMGLVLAVGMQRVDSSTWKLDSAGQVIVQSARAARALAVLRQHDVIVSFDVDALAVVVHEDVNGDGQIDDGERVRRQPLEGKVEFTRGSAPTYAGFTDGPITFGSGSVTFRRNGSASEEGAVYVGRPGLDRARLVVISRATGYAEMLRYNGSTWLSE